MSSANIAIRMPHEELEALETEAEHDGRSRSGQARWIIREHLRGRLNGHGVRTEQQSIRDRSRRQSQTAGSSS
jgi:hypothetical protein